ncbi:unnamed protein product [Clonostachys solani]|uniref:Uncharacterized protein n=1 Tax=Clonostachys solani TaxID=160281 RepID=A0A9N9ZHH4_9HYPO|nr:unnamed protein product [Clonostachys solani]
MSLGWRPCRYAPPPSLCKAEQSALTSLSRVRRTTSQEIRDDSLVVFGVVNGDARMAGRALGTLLGFEPRIQSDIKIKEKWVVGQRSKDAACSGVKQHIDRY